MTSSPACVLARALFRLDYENRDMPLVWLLPHNDRLLSDRTARTDEVIHSGWCEMSAVLTRRNTQDPYESYPHLFLVGETTVVRNRRDSIRCFLEAAPRCIYADCLDGFRRGAAARLRIKPREVPGAHVYTLRKRLDPEVAFQIF